MSANVDPSLLRRRKAVELSAVAARGSALVCMPLFLLGWLGIPIAGVSGTLFRVCYIVMAVMTVSTTFAAINFRRPAGRFYTPLSAAQVVCDTIVMSGIVLVFQLYYPSLTTWPGLVIPIVAGGVRHQLRGAISAWVITSLAFAAVLWGLGHRAVRPDDLPFAIVLHGLIAVLSGTQASAFLRQVTELGETKRALEHQATHDVLTGLPNRALLAEYATEYDGRELTVLLLDLNGFKQVNDTLGHTAGDQVLHEVGKRLTVGLRPGDRAARLGGDEFLVLLPDTGAAASADIVARLRAEVARPVDLGGGTATVGVSIGAAHRASGEARGMDALTVEADAAMYREKQHRHTALHPAV